MITATAILKILTNKNTYIIIAIVLLISFISFLFIQIKIKDKQISNLNIKIDNLNISNELLNKNNIFLSNNIIREENYKIVYESISNIENDKLTSNEIAYLNSLRELFYSENLNYE